VARLVLLFLVTMSVVANAQGLKWDRERAYPGFDALLEKHGIGKRYSADNAEKLRGFLSRAIASIGAERSEDKKVQKDREKKLKYYQSVAELVDRSAFPEMDYVLALRALYSIEAEPFSNAHGSLGDLLTLAGKTLKKPTMPYMAASDITASWERVYLNTGEQPDTARKLARRRIAEESTDLFNDATGKFYSPDELYPMTIEQISRLDIHEHDPMWYTEKAVDRPGFDPWTELEQWNESVVTQHLKLDGEHRYSLASAQRVLFLDGIKDTATSPKADVTDAYGLKWKMKWGNEVQPEVIATRLYMKAGAKYNDLVYTHTPGERNHVLILQASEMDASRRKDPQFCASIATVGRLKHCLLTSRFNYDISASIFEAGTVTEAPWVADMLPAPRADGFGDQDIAGRTYIVFNEVVVEFKAAEGRQTGGPAAMNDPLTAGGRVLRGLALFNHWIWNSDAKDANNRGVFVTSDAGRHYQEAYTDLGASLGKLLQNGRVDTIPWGDEFLTVDRDAARSFESKIVVHQANAYVPGVWGRMTFADGRWMANKIARLSRADIAEAIGHGCWPGFVQELLVEKMVSRRDRIVEYFGVAQDAVTAEPRVRPDAFEIAYTFPDLDAVLSVGRSLHLADPAVIAELKRVGKLRSDGTFVPFDEVLVRHGKMQACNKTLFIGLLERTLYPAGLSRRISRYHDSAPLGACSLGADLTRQ